MPTSCVYILYNVEGYYYIGQTKDLYSRLVGHRWGFRNNGPCSSKKLGAYWDCEILEECTEVDLYEAERYYYDFFHEIDSEHCVNKDKPLQTAEEYYSNNAEKIKKNVSEYRAKNTEKVKACKRTWSAKNPGVAVQRVKQWRIDNPDKYRAQQRKSRHKKLLAKIT